MNPPEPDRPCESGNPPGESSPFGDHAAVASALSVDHCSRQVSAATAVWMFGLACCSFHGIIRAQPSSQDLESGREALTRPRYCAIGHSESGSPHAEATVSQVVAYWTIDMDSCPIRTLPYHRLEYAERGLFLEHTVNLENQEE
jgi:hypothetical protein